MESGKSDLLKQVSHDFIYEQKYLETNALNSVDDEVYRISSALPEISCFSNIRASLDAQIAARENTGLYIQSNDQTYFNQNLTINELVNPNDSNMLQLVRFTNEEVNETLRTFAVLFCLNTGNNFEKLNENEIKSLLGQTCNFSDMLTVDEILMIRDRGSQIDSPIISFLALIMLNDNDPNDDREYSLRMSFQELLIRDFDSEIIKFLAWLNTRTPGLCSAVIQLCDISFLEKLYIIYDSYEIVLKQRLAIYTWASSVFDDKNYTLIAEQLKVDAKVREIRGVLDDSRIFVDEMRFKQWLSENILSDMRRHKRQIELLTPDTSETNTKNIDFQGPSRHLFMAIDTAFNEFCHNKLFGIDSYLSRRIRHGTLVGYLLSPIKSAFSDFKNYYSDSITPEECTQLDEIYRNYANILYRLRDDVLHFNHSGKPDGLFSSDLLTNNTRLKILNLIKRQFYDFLEDGTPVNSLIDTFPIVCWLFLETDLENVRTEINRTFVHEVRPILKRIGSIDKNNMNFSNLRTDLEQQAGELFKETQGWFHRPEPAVMNVTVGEIAEAVNKEIREHKPESDLQCDVEQKEDTTISGVSYHTIYDIFYVLFDNAASYADTGTTIKIMIGNCEDENDVIRISVSTEISENDTEESVRQSIDTAISAYENHEEAMTLEGNSGLGKVISLINSHEKRGAYSWEVKNNFYIFSFSLPIVLVLED